MKIIVLGAGVIGVTSAWYLTCAGHEVTVIDRQPAAGLETSFANGGQISAGHAEPWASPSVVPDILRWLGREDAPLLFRPRADWAQWAWGLRFLRECLPGQFERNTRDLAGLALYSRDSLRELRAQTGIAYDHLERGILNFSTAAESFDAMARHAEAMAALGVHNEVKTAAECLSIEPALAGSRSPVVGGVYAPQDESGDAHRFTQALLDLAVQRGAVFMPGICVSALEAEGGRIVAAHLSGASPARLGADAFVVALGSYSPLLLRPLGIRIPVYPLKGYSITIELSADAAALAPTVSLTDDAALLAMSRLDNRLRAAGTAELNGYDCSINAVRCQAILDRVTHLFPGVERGGAVQRWAGLRPATPSNAPLIGATRYANLYLNTGHGTLGWTLACGSGRVLTDLIGGRRPAVNHAFF